MPDEGSQFRLTDSARMSMMPARRRYRHADHADQGQREVGHVLAPERGEHAHRNAEQHRQASAVLASSRVFGRRWPMRQATGSLLVIEVPRSPRNMPPSHCRIGRAAADPCPADESAPRAARRDVHAHDRRWPPGARLTSRNVIALTSSSTSAPCTVRCAATRSTARLFLEPPFGDVVHVVAQVQVGTPCKLALMTSISSGYQRKM